MSEKDPYKVLGVSKDASVQEIRKVYKKLSKMFHPDSIQAIPKYIEDPEKAQEIFSEISKAAQLLLNKEKREIYDKWGHDGKPDFNELGTLGMDGEVFGVNLKEFVGGNNVND